MCEHYSGGQLCDPYLKGQQVYVNPSRASQAQTGNRVEINYNMLNGYVSSGCRNYVLPTLCNYAFPPCDQAYSAAKPKKFCRDDCLILKNDICEWEFKQISRHPYLSHLLPNCSSMPTVGDPDYKRCIRVVPKGRLPQQFISFHLNDHTLGFHPQTLKLEPPCTA